MTDTLITQMAQTVQDAAALLPPRTESNAADTWPDVKVAFDAVERPLIALLRDRLERIRPGVEWADEFGSELPGTGERWVVDPIDGAVQYLQGLPQWAVSVSLVRDGQPVAAALHSATFGQTYTATLGGGAFRNGAPIAPSTRTNLELALIGMSHPPFFAQQPDAVAATGRAMPVLLPAAGPHRNLGPTSWQVADVASGRMDAFWQYGQDAGNLLGASLVAREAGATVTEITGRPWQAGSTSFLAAPASLHGQLLDLFAQAEN
ncbi:MAG TPA: inositol monophosphatase [Actinocrinis sp.]|nr:inositol monophosphatase [Actinocrinis sp.]